MVKKKAQKNDREEQADSQAEQAPRESEERYGDLFDHSLSGVGLHEIVLDAEGHPVDYIFLEVNRAFEELTGLSADKIIGKRVTEVLPGIEDSVFIEVYGRVAWRTGSLRAVFSTARQALRNRGVLTAQGSVRRRVR